MDFNDREWGKRAFTAWTAYVMPPHKNPFHSHKDLHEEQSSKIEYEQKLDH